MDHLSLITGYISMGPAWLLMIVIAIVSFIVQWPVQKQIQTIFRNPAVIRAFGPGGCGKDAA